MKLNKTIIIIVLIAAGIALIVYLHSINRLDWQTLTILGAVIAAPFRSLFHFLSGEDDTKYDQPPVVQDADRKNLEEQVVQIQAGISQIQKNIDEMGRKINELETQKSRILNRIESMPFEGKQSTLDEAFG